MRDDDDSFDECEISVGYSSFGASLSRGRGADVTMGDDSSIWMGNTPLDDPKFVAGVSVIKRHSKMRGRERRREERGEKRIEREKREKRREKKKK